MVKGKTDIADSVSLLVCDLSPSGTGSPLDRGDLTVLIAAPASHITSGRGLGSCHLGNQFTSFQKAQCSQFFLLGWNWSVFLHFSPT